MLQRIRHQWGPTDDLWVFGYASLIWRPEFDADEHRPGLVRGWHRALRMRSRVNRGTPDRPGLVFALMPGGSCRGMVYRVARARADAELDRLWAREMINSVYDPRWLPCQTAQGRVMALAFTLSRRSPSYTGRLPDEEIIQILRLAQGHCGSTLDYLCETARCLDERGMTDHEVRRLMALARQHRLA
ncbi:gamma-glutamylcyclotransferase [Aquincola agrisoli]